MNPNPPHRRFYSDGRGIWYIDRFWKLAEDGLETLVDKTFPLEDVVEAHRYVEAEKNFGRVVLTI